MYVLVHFYICLALGVPCSSDFCDVCLINKLQRDEIMLPFLFLYIRDEIICFIFQSYTPYVILLIGYCINTHTEQYSKGI